MEKKTKMLIVALLTAIVLGVGGSFMYDEQSGLILGIITYFGLLNPNIW